MIKPYLLPTEVRHDREKPLICYEFYNPSISARQMGFGQLPPCVFFADKLKPREAVNSGLEFNRILQFERSLLVEIITEWNCQPYCHLLITPPNFLVSVYICICNFSRSNLGHH
jgi:hypothetical protein